MASTSAGVQNEAVAMLDAAIGSKLKLSPGALKAMLISEKELASKLAGLPCGGDDDSTSDLLLEEGFALQERIDTLEQKHAALLVQAAASNGEFAGVGAAIRDGVDEVSHLQRLGAYFAWIQRIQQLDQRLQDTVEHGVSQSGPPYQALGSLVTELGSSACTNLHRYAAGILAGWRDRLTVALRSEFSDAAHTLELPYIGAHSPHDSVDWARFDDSFLRLMTFETDASGIVEPLNLLFAPLYARFAYHFTTDGVATNIFLDPRFMLEWVAQTIDENAQVLSGRVQRILGRAGRQDVDAKLLLIRGLAERVRKRISQDIGKMDDTDEHAILLCGMARELLMFDDKMQNLYGYEDETIIVSAVIVNDQQVKEKWLDTEYRIVGDKYDECCAIGADGEFTDQADTTTDITWDRAFPMLHNLDTVKSPMSTQAVLDLLQTVVDLAKLVPERYAAVRLHVLQEFHIKMLSHYRESLDVETQQLLHTFGGRFDAAFVERLCLAANAMWCVHSALVSWDDELLFVSLDGIAVEAGSAAHAEGAGGTGVTEAVDERGSAGSSYGMILDSEITAFEELQQRVVKQLSDLLLRPILPLVRDYFRQLQQKNTASASRLATLDFSPGMSKICQQNKAFLVAIKQHLCAGLASSFWAEHAVALDTMVHSQITLTTGFTAAIVKQFVFDIRQGFLAFFAAVAFANSQPATENRFRWIVESCTLLSLDEGNWSRLCGLLGMSTCGADQTTELQRLGVFQLSRKAAAAVLKLRVDFKAASKPSNDGGSGSDGDDLL